MGASPLRYQACHWQPFHVFDVDQYGNSAKEKDIDGSLSLFQMSLGV